MSALLVAKLYWRLLEFEKAQGVAEEALTSSSPPLPLRDWLELALFTARLYRETSQSEKFEALWEKLRSSSGENEVRSSFNYFEAQLAAEAGDLGTAERLFQIAEVSALTEADLDRASYGLALIPYFQRDWGTALERLSALRDSKPQLELDVMFAVVSSLVTVHLERREISSAERELLQAQHLVRRNHSLYHHVMLLLTEGYYQLHLGKMENVRSRVEWIERLIPQNQKNILGRRFLSLKERLAVAEAKPALRLTEKDEKITLSWEDRSIELQRLPQLLRLILLFKKRGGLLEKELICQEIWGEAYHPLRHDNKIYVTIKRLRAVLKSLAPDQEIILKKEQGYLFNPRIGLSVLGQTEGEISRNLQMEVS